MAYAVATDAAGGAVVAGYVLSGPPEARDFDWRVIAIDHDGEVRRDARLDRTPVDLAADGGSWVAGYTTSSGAGFEDGWVSKLDRAGRR